MTEQIQQHQLANAAATTKNHYSAAQPSAISPVQKQQQTAGHTVNLYRDEKSAIPPKLRGKRRATTPASADLDSQLKLTPSTATTLAISAINSVVNQVQNECSSISSTSSASTPIPSTLLPQRHSSQRLPHSGALQNSISIVSPGSPSSIVQSSQHHQQIFDQQFYRPPKMQKVQQQQRSQFSTASGEIIGNAFGAQHQQRLLTPVVIPTPRHYQHPGAAGQILLTDAGMN